MIHKRRVIGRFNAVYEVGRYELFSLIASYSFQFYPLNSLPFSLPSYNEMIPSQNALLLSSGKIIHSTLEYLGSSLYFTSTKSSYKWYSLFLKKYIRFIYFKYSQFFLFFSALSYPFPSKTAKMKPFKNKQIFIMHNYSHITYHINIIIRIILIIWIILWIFSILILILFLHLIFMFIWIHSLINLTLQGIFCA